MIVENRRKNKMFENQTWTIAGLQFSKTPLEYDNWAILPPVLTIRVQGKQRNLVKIDIRVLPRTCIFFATVLFSQSITIKFVRQKNMLKRNHPSYLQPTCGIMRKEYVSNFQQATTVEANSTKLPSLGLRLRLPAIFSLSLLISWSGTRFTSHFSFVRPSYRKTLPHSSV